MVLGVAGLLSPFDEAAAQVSAPLPGAIEPCERSILKFCGQWTWNGAQYAASWSDGSRALLSVTRFDGRSIALHRVDTADSKNTGMSADYVGQIHGGEMKGNVTYTWPGHVPPVGYGTWSAKFDPAASSASPVAPTAPVATNPTTSPSAAGAGSPAAGASGAGDCPLPAVPLSWLNATTERSTGQLWKVDEGILSYTDSIQHKAMTLPIRRPMFWRRWAACAPPQFAPQIADDAGFWIWISDDRRQAKLFDLVSGNHMLMTVFTVPAALVLADEEQRPE